MATKRQIRIVENFIKNETKRILSEADKKIDTSRLSKANSKIEGTKRIVDQIINACQTFKKGSGADLNNLISFIESSLKTLKRL